MNPSHTSRVVELKIPSELGNEKIAREVAATVAKRVGFDAERIADIKMAISEACTNAISYGSKADSRNKITVILTAHDEKLEIVVIDPGLGGPPPSNVNNPDIEDMIDGIIPPGGMGLWLITELMDEAQFIQSEEDDSTEFHMVIYRNKNIEQ